VGGELKSLQWTFDGKLYFPLGTRVRSDPTSYNAKLVPSPIPRVYNIGFNQGVEVALLGADAEIGHTVPIIPGLTMYAGGYGFSGAHHASGFYGPIIRAVYSIGEDKIFSTNRFLEAMQVETIWHEDKVHGNSFSVGLIISLDAWGTPRAKMNGIERRMIERVPRNINMRTSTDKDRVSSLVLNSKGLPLTVGLATNEATLYQTVDVLGVQGTINQTQTLTLPHGQTITGGVYEYLPGRLIQVGYNGTLQSSVNDLVLVRATQDNTVEHLTFNMFGNTQLGNTNNIALSNSLANGIGQTVGQLNVFENTFNNSGMSILIGDNSSNSNINVINNSFTINEGSHPGDYNASAVELKFANSSSLTVDHVDDNTIVMSGSGGKASVSAIDIGTDEQSVEAPSRLTVNNVQGNTLDMLFHNRCEPWRAEGAGE